MCELCIWRGISSEGYVSCVLRVEFQGRESLCTTGNVTDDNWRC